jgi:hypothetical protein
MYDKILKNSMVLSKNIYIPQSLIHILRSASVTHNKENPD